MDMKRIGSKIAYYRKIRGMTQVELAEKAEMSASYISRIERGASVQGIPLTIYLRLAVALGVTLEDLYRD